MISRAVDAYREVAEKAGLGPCWFEPPLHFDFFDVDPQILQKADGLIFSSQTAVESVARVSDLVDLRGKRCWAIGSATAAAARQQGMSVCGVIDGGGARFVEAVLERKMTLSARRLVWPCPSEVAFPLDRALGALGIEVTAVVSYRSLPAQRCSIEAQQWLFDHKRAYAGLFSQSCAAAYKNWRKEQLRFWAPSVIFAIGPRVVEGLNQTEKLRCLYPQEASREAFVQMLHNFRFARDENGE